MAQTRQCFSYPFSSVFICGQIFLRNPAMQQHSTISHMTTDEHAYVNSLTEQVLGAIFEVSNTLGAGFLEKVYRRALLRELSLCDIRATSEAGLSVMYK